MILTSTVFFTAVATNFILSAISQGINSRRALNSLKKRHEYEKEILEKGHQKSMEAFDAICKAQIEVAITEYKQREKQLEKDYNSELELTAYLSDLDKWPLNVPPAVLRCDTLVDGLRSDDDNKFAPSLIARPLFVCMAPSGYPSFDAKILPQLNDSLSIYFNRFWAADSGHPVFFLTDIWKKNESVLYGASCEDIIDSATIQMISDKTQDVPSLVIQPYIFNSQLGLDLYFWGLSLNDADEDIPTANALHKISIEFESSHSFAPDETYSEEDAKEIIQDLSRNLQIIISIKNDVYMWTHYRIAPQLLDVIASSGMEVCQEEIDKIYETYVQMMLQSISLGEVDPYVNQAAILECCIHLDGTAGQKAAFDAYVNQLAIAEENTAIKGVDRLLYLPEYSFSFQNALIEFSLKYQSLYGIKSEIIKKLQFDYWTRFLLNDAHNLINSKYEGNLFSKVKKDDIFDAYGEISDFYQGIEGSCHDKVKETVDKYRTCSVSNLEERVRDEVNNLLNPLAIKMAKKLREKCQRAVIKYKADALSSFTDSICQKHIDSTHFPQDDFESIRSFVFQSLKADCQNNSYDQQTHVEWGQDKYESIAYKIAKCASRIADVWVKYKLFGDDYIRSSISDEKENELRYSMKSTFCDDLITSLSSYIESSLMIKKYPSYASDSEEEVDMFMYRLRVDCCG